MREECVSRDADIPLLLEEARRGRPQPWCLEPTKGESFRLVTFRQLHWRFFYSPLASLAKDLNFRSILMSVNHPDLAGETNVNRIAGRGGHFGTSHNGHMHVR